jgi:HEAT repeat protein
MASSISITTLTLAFSKNKSAVSLLEKALDSSSKEVRKSAGNQLINMTGIKNVWKLINKFDPADEIMVSLFNAHREKVFSALRAAITGDDPYLARNAFRVIYTQRYFEILPIMLTAFLDQDRSEEENNSLSEGILKLTEKYVRALDERKHRKRLNEMVLSEVVTALLRGLKDFHRNDPDLFILVFLQLYPFLTDKHSALTKLLYVPSSALYGVVHHFLLSGREPYVFRFFVHCFSNSNPPPIALTIFSKRFDMPFIAYFLKNLEKPISTSLKINLAAVRPIEWLNSFRALLDRLDEQAQAGLVLLVQNVGLSDNEIQSKLLDLLHYGKTMSRLEALTALSRFSGEEIDQLIWDAGGDADPNIQANALVLLSKRNIQNANFRILQFANSPHDIVRETIQKLLPDFRLLRFFEMFDQLTEEQRRSMFNVVKVLDSQMVNELARILIVGEPRDKAKALFCIDYGSMVLALEDSLCSVLAKGELAAIRVKAAELLAAGQRDLSRSTLVQALHRDPDPTVRTTAKNSLEKRPPPWEQLKKTK